MLAGSYSVKDFLEYNFLDGWLSSYYFVHIYAPDVLAGYSWSNDLIGVVINDHTTSPIMQIMRSCYDEDCLNYGKLHTPIINRLRKESAGYLQVDIVDDCQVSNVEFVPILDIADISLQLIGRNWIPPGSIKNEILYFFKHGLLINNRNRASITVWIRWLNTNRYGFIHVHI